MHNSQNKIEQLSLIRLVKFKDMTVVLRCKFFNKKTPLIFIMRF